MLFSDRHLGELPGASFEAGAACVLRRRFPIESS